MQLPAELRQAIEEEATAHSHHLLHEASHSLTRRYRSMAAASGPPMSAKHDRIAYLAARLPATYAAARQIAAQAIAGIPGLEVESLLDLGSGPGTAMWAAADAFAGLERVTLIERDPALIFLGKRLAAHSNRSPVREAGWQSADITTLEEYPRHDAVFLSYVVGELSSAKLKKVVTMAWSAAEKLLAIIEPGTPKGFSHILSARQELIALGASIAAPCPHDRDCPMSGSDWCHFAVRVERTSLHRRIKSGTLSYEDEKYSYVVATRAAVERAGARVIRHPIKPKGHVRLDLCGPRGLTKEIVSRKNKERYRAARKSEWGSPWPFDDE
jgi:ribosomal protein RSM22 (predicted rRNA methylase)